MLSAENLAAIESEGRRMAIACRRDPELAVPHYPDWSLADLASHVGSIFGRTAHLASELPTEKVSAPRLPESADPIDWYEEQLEEMLAALTAADPDAPCWAFAHGSTVGFWEIRMVCEIGIHRWDAYDAHGEADRLLDVVASLGLDEFGPWYVPLIEADGGLEMYAHDLHRTWVFGEPPLTRVEGTASDLYLRLMQRTSPVDLPQDWASAVDAFGKPPKR